MKKKPKKKVIFLKKHNTYGYAILFDACLCKIFCYDERKPKKKVILLKKHNTYDYSILFDACLHINSMSVSTSSKVCHIQEKLIININKLIIIEKLLF